MNICYWIHFLLRSCLTYDILLRYGLLNYCRILRFFSNYILFCVQALLDVYTIEREIGRLDGIRLGLVGDLANGRTVRSLAYLIAKYQDVKIYFVSPDVVKMKV